MERKYKNTKEKTVVNFFYGEEVEQSPAHGMGTLFVTGVHPLKDILKEVEQCNKDLNLVDHIYCGANQSFQPEVPEDWKLWEEMLFSLLQQNFWVTLDFDVKYAEEFHESGLTEHRKFIPMISVKLPYLSLFNYNTTVKIDDKGFEATNPGVWCHRLNDLMDTKKFTSWDEYKNDEAIT